MHCIQYIAVQADDTDMAFRAVKNHLENLLGGEYDNTNTWFDWFVTGGGRWATGDDNQYNDNWTGDVAHQSSPKFQEYLDTALRFRQEELTHYIRNARKINLSDILDIAEAGGEDYFKVGHQLYDVKKLYDLTMGVWDYTSYFFDIQNDTTTTKYMLESIDKGENSWYIVPVDFHF